MLNSCLMDMTFRLDEKGIEDIWKKNILVHIFTCKN